MYAIRSYYAARLEGNPFRQYIDRVCEAAGVDFIVNVTIDRAKRPSGFFAGDVRLAYAEGCRQAASHAIVHLDEPADLVITTGGGYPLDATLYQSTKGLLAAKEIVRSYNFV